MRNETNTMQYEAIPARDTAGEWVVEAINHDNDGEVYMARFSGPHAEDRANEYAAWKNSGIGLSNEQPRQSLSGKAVSVIRRNNADKLHAVRAVAVQHGSTTDPVDRNAVNQVSRSLSTGADIAGEETKGVGIKAGVSKPTDLRTDAQRRLDWTKLYQSLWQAKIADRAQDDG